MRLRRKLLPAALILGGTVLFLWWQFSPFNGPSKAIAPDQLEALLRERIKLPAGYRIDIYAQGLGQPRLMQMTESGDLLVSGYRGGTILLVAADGDGDGRSDRQSVLREGLNLPHGLVLEGNTLLVAEESRVVSYDFDSTKLSNQRVILTGVPEGGGHSSRTLKRGPDGFLYLSTGSSCNACIEDNPWRAAIIRFKESSQPELFASGLRNTVGFDWQPQTGALFGVDNGRDNLGDDVPDDEVNRIERGKHYGWPYVHGNGVKDPKMFFAMPADVTPVPQVHGLGAHVAALSILFLEHQSDAALNGTALVAEHGSWNRSKKSGYRIVRLIFDGTSIREEVFMSGCEANDEVICRPVDILEASDGTLFVSDDYAGAIYRIVKSR
ncbi:MAG TPA: PQQ-dependent sugar dehydrogenase [Aestuariivirga sp.]|nr:PQQ-dependent sugar dehydrogenase [Aestuariivirga sp.]